MLPTRDPLQTQGYSHTQSEGMKKRVFYANINQKRIAVAMLISDKIDFKIKIIKRDKEGHCMIIKGSTQEEDRIIVNIYEPNIGAP